MKNPFSSPETRLAKFSMKFRRKKSVADIPYPKLRAWQEDTVDSRGTYLRKYMAADIWGESAKSLATAASIIRTLPAKFLAANRSAVSVAQDLEVHALRRIKSDYEAKHGKISALLVRLKKGKEKK
ncbi:MAG TPA: hypothetical protein VGV09_07720 [Steroidobacteraceae bacterium]|nr:hypothetical protein [Steroidobacteraceae bacterium]